MRKTSEEMKAFILDWTGSFWIEGKRYQLGDMLDEVDREFFPDLLRHFVPVLPVFFGQDDLLKTDAGSSQDFFFNAADGKNSSAQADFTGHRDVRTDEPPSKQGGQSDHDGRSCAGTIFRGS